MPEIPHPSDFIDLPSPTTVRGGLPPGIKDSGGGWCAPTDYVLPAKIDRTDWPAGEWDTEPDREEWETVAGLPGLIRRTQMGGHWCGYVGITKGHPLYGLDHEDAEVPSNAGHWGLTWSKGLAGEDPDLWYFGFDCAHCDDFLPAIHGLLKRKGHEMQPYGIYRNMGYVKGQVESLAKQLAAHDKETSQ